MTLYLIRHAHAGDRHSWKDEDRLRPLSPVGQEQALALVEMLGARGLDRVLSGPAVRCTETVEPLARAIGCHLEVVRELLEGSDPTGVIRILEAGAAENMALCTHGDLIPEVIELLRRRGTEITGETGNSKGSWWEIEPGTNGFRSATYHPRP